jgi:hypothetical protein
MSDLPPYVSRRGHGEQSVEPPGVVRGARVFFFVLRADPVQAQKFVDVELNEPADGALRYRVAARRAALSFLDGSLTSSTEPIGYLADHEFACWMPLAVFAPGRSEPSGLVYYNPYLIVDSSAAMATGREVWGFAKEVGALEMPSGPSAAARFAAQANLIDKFGPDAHARMATLVEIANPGPCGDLSPSWSSAGEAYREVTETLRATSTDAPVLDWKGDALLLFDLLKGMIAHHVPVVNLKQFRDAADPTRACYQAIVESACTVHAVHGGGWLRQPFVLRITPCESHPLAADLGLAGNEVPVEHAFWVDMDFTADLGREVWRAP